MLKVLEIRDEGTSEKISIPKTIWTKKVWCNTNLMRKQSNIENFMLICEKNVHRRRSQVNIIMAMECGTIFTRYMEINKGGTRAHYKISDLSRQFSIKWLTD